MTEGGNVFSPFPGRRPGWLLEADRKIRPRGMAVTRVGLPACHTEPGLQAGWQFSLCAITPRIPRNRSPLGRQILGFLSKNQRFVNVNAP
jgi:hypothetical protein